MTTSTCFDLEDSMSKEKNSALAAPGCEKQEFYSFEELKALARRDVSVPSPQQVYIGREVPLRHIGKGSILYPFCRITGSRTSIHPNARIGPRGSVVLENSIVGRESVIGSQGPVCLIDSQTGPLTVLGSGTAEQSVFLGKETKINDFTTGVGFRARKGTLYEEDASSAQHTDTKMSVLFPWVTLGSNVNLCDLMMTGGVGPEIGKFTEVGSGTVHFNFTIRGDKATASLFGNVPAGVFLREKRLFIGGNNSLIGPIQAEFGALTAAGARIAGNLKNGLNMGQALTAGHREYDPRIFTRSKEIVEQQVHYVAQLVALCHWYEAVRFPLAQSDPERLTLFQAARQILVLNIHERISQIGSFIEALDTSIRLLEQQPLLPRETIKEQKILLEHWPRLKQHLQGFENHFREMPSPLAAALQESASRHGPHYTRIIRNLPRNCRDLGKSWLESIVHRVTIQVSSENPSI